MQNYTPPRPHSLGAFDARPPVPISDGLDTRRRKILDPRLSIVYICDGNSAVTAVQ